MDIYDFDYFDEDESDFIEKYLIKIDNLDNSINQLKGAISDCSDSIVIDSIPDCKERI